MFAETDRFIKELSEQSKQTSKQIEATDRQLKATDTKLNNLIGTWGSFLEGIVEPAALCMFDERGIEVRNIFPNSKIKKNGQVLMEIDILLTNGEYAVLIEVKTTLRVDDVNNHIERLNRFRQYLPEYANKKAIGAVAGIKIHEGADQYASNQGLFVIVRSGDSVIILNVKTFQPKDW